MIWNYRVTSGKSTFWHRMFRKLHTQAAIITTRRISHGRSLRQKYIARGFHRSNTLYAENKKNLMPRQLVRKQKNWKFQVACLYAVEDHDWKQWSEVYNKLELNTWKIFGVTACFHLHAASGYLMVDFEDTYQIKPRTLLTMCFSGSLEYPSNYRAQLQ